MKDFVGTDLLPGCLADDLQHSMLKNRANLKKELCNTLEIDESKPIILVAAPPNQLVAGVRPGFELITSELA